MSRENVELIHQTYDAVNRRDLAGFLALMDEDVRAESRLAPMEGGYNGHDGSRRWWENLLEAFPDFTVEVVAVRDLGDLTLAELRNRGHSASSHVPLEERLWHLAEWRGGKLVWWSAHLTEAEALEAAESRSRAATPERRP